MVEAEATRLSGCGDFATGVRWAMEHLREEDDKCTRFSDRGDGE